MSSSATLADEPELNSTGHLAETPISSPPTPYIMATASTLQAIEVTLYLKKKLDLLTEVLLKNADGDDIKMVFTGYDERLEGLQAELCAKGPEILASATAVQTDETVSTYVKPPQEIISCDSRAGARTDVMPPQEQCAGRNRECPSDMTPRYASKATGREDSRLCLIPREFHLARSSRRVIIGDDETELHNSEIRHNQDERSAITREPEWLPGNRALLCLQEMQRRGRFIHEVVGDDRMEEWAPELRYHFDLTAMRKAGASKREWQGQICED